MVIDCTLAAIVIFNGTDGISRTFSFSVQFILMVKMFAIVSTTRKIPFSMVIIIYGRICENLQWKCIWNNYKWAKQKHWHVGRNNFRIKHISGAGILFEWELIFSRFIKISKCMHLRMYFCDGKALQKSVMSNVPFLLLILLFDRSKNRERSLRWRLKSFWCLILNEPHKLIQFN